MACNICKQNDHNKKSCRVPALTQKLEDHFKRNISGAVIEEVVVTPTDKYRRVTVEIRIKNPSYIPLKDLNHVAEYLAIPLENVVISDFFFEHGTGFCDMDEIFASIFADSVNLDFLEVVMKPLSNKKS